MSRKDQMPKQATKAALPVDLQNMIADDTEYVDTVAQGRRLKSEPPGGEAEYVTVKYVFESSINQVGKNAL